MTHTFRVHFFHLIWSTRKRSPCIDPCVQPRLYAYIGGILKKHDGSLLAVGGMPDHVHLLVELSNPDDFTGLIRDIKSCSSSWLRNQFSGFRDFGWQQGYGSFSVSYSQLDAVKTYIKNQETHHISQTFDAEFLGFLTKHCVAYDERFVLDA